MQNHSEIAEFLWKIADLIKDDYDAKNYEDVILPFTLLRRLDCVLEPTRQAVREAAEKYKAIPEQTRDALADAKPQASVLQHLRVFARRTDQAARLTGAQFRRLPGRLFDQRQGHPLQLFRWRGKRTEPHLRNPAAQAVAVQDDAGLQPRPTFRPKTSDNHGMGTIFEYLIRKFKEASNEAAGQFYTPRDIIRLMVKLMFEPDRDKLAKENLIGIYDPACGTGGMLTIAKEYLLAAINPNLGDSSVRPGDQREDLRHRQGRHADEGGETRTTSSGKTPSATTCCPAGSSTTCSPIRPSAKIGRISAMRSRPNTGLARPAVTLPACPTWATGPCSFCCTR